MGGLAGGADLIVIPEFPLTMDQIIAHLVKRRSSSNAFSIVVVAEGINLETLGCAVHDDLLEGSAACDRHEGVGQFVAAQIDAHGLFEVRTTVLGHSNAGEVPAPTTVSGPRASAPPPTTRWSRASSGVELHPSGFDWFTANFTGTRPGKKILYPLIGGYFLFVGLIPSGSSFKAYGTSGAGLHLLLFFVLF